MPWRALCSVTVVQTGNSYTAWPRAYATAFFVRGRSGAERRGHLSAPKKFENKCLPPCDILCDILCDMLSAFHALSENSTSVRTVVLQHESCFTCQICRTLRRFSYFGK